MFGSVEYIVVDAESGAHDVYPIDVDASLQHLCINFCRAKFNVQHWRALPGLLGLKGAQIMEICYQLTLAHHITGHPHESPSSARHRNQVACEDRA